MIRSGNYFNAWEISLEMLLSALGSDKNGRDYCIWPGFYNGHREQELKPIFRFVLKTQTCLSYTCIDVLIHCHSIKMGHFGPGQADTLRKWWGFSIRIMKESPEEYSEAAGKICFLRRSDLTQVIRLACYEDITMWPGFWTVILISQIIRRRPSLSHQQVRIPDERQLIIQNDASAY